MLRKIRKILLMDEHICPSWFSFSLDNRIRKLAHDPEKMFRQWVHEGDTVLDIGCGPGYFTVPLALMVGDTGRIIAVDIQDKMISRVKKNLEKHGLKKRATVIKALPDDLSVREHVDFALTFWMVHEVRDLKAFFSQVRKTLKPGARYVLVEPKVHVTASKYNAIIEAAKACGLKPESKISVSFSRGMIFTA